MHLNMKFGAVVAAVALAWSSAEAQTLDLKLVCDGTGRKDVEESSKVTQYGQNLGSVSSTRTLTFPATLRVEIAGQTGRIFIPANLRPLLRGGGQEGWWTLNNLQITDEAITGQFSMNVLRNPRVRIDRTRGQIEVSGMFNGTCELAPDPSERKF